MNLSRIWAQKSLNGGSADARNGFLFSLEILEWDYDMNSPEGKTAFFREAARRLIGFEDELERNNYIEAVAKIYQIERGKPEKTGDEDGNPGWTCETGGTTEVHL